MAATQRLTIAKFDGVRDTATAGKHIVVSWERLATAMSKFEQQAFKKDVTGWSPALFRPMCDCGEGDCRGDHGHRITENVLEVYALVLDLDKRPDKEPLDQATADAALAHLAALGLRHIVHTTHSHAPPAAVSLRVIVALSRPVSVADWTRFWPAAVHRLGIHVEASCCNADRFWYSPSCQPNTEGWSTSIEGAPLDVDALLASIAPAEPVQARNDNTRSWPKQGEFDFDAFRARYFPGAKEYQRRGRRCWEIECPWESEHSSSSPRDTVVSIGDDGKPGFSCKHDHCAGRHWQDFRAQIDPEYATFRANGFKPTSGSSRINGHAHRPPLDEETLAVAARDDDPPRHVGFLDSVNNATDTGGNAPVDWPEPKPLGEYLPPVEEFCIDLLPLDLKAWVWDIAHRMSVPLDLPAVAAMCALSVVATNARTIRPKRKDPWRVWPILWGAAIAPPGSKKTPATSEAFKLLDALDLRSRSDFAGGASEREAVEIITTSKIAALKDMLKKAQKDGDTQKLELLQADLKATLTQQEEEVAKPRRYVAQDATVEKITDVVGHGAKRRSYPLGVKWDELLGFFHLFDRDGREADRAFYLEGWSATTRATDRVGRGSVICRDLALVVYGNMTPEPFEAYVREATGGGGADGLLQRFQLVVYPDRMKPGPMVDEYRDEEAIGRARRLFERLAALDEEDDEGRPPALRFANDAQDFYFEWHAELEKMLATSEDHVSIRSHFAKYASLMPSIALICHLADGPGAEHRPVSLWAAKQAAGWCDYLRSHANRIYSLVTSRDRFAAGEIVKRIQAGKLVGLMTTREVYRHCKLDPQSAKAGLELLDELGWVRISLVKTRGRPSEMVEINPRSQRS